MAANQTANNNKPFAMKLSGGQTGQLHQALLSAFLDVGSLRIFVGTKLEEKLNVIAAGENYSEVVFALVEWAESRGRIEELVTKASEENPNNPDLKRFVESYRVGQAEPAVAGKPTFAKLCEQYKDTLKPYLDFLVRTNETLDPRGMGKDLRQGALKLNEVYVSLAVERKARKVWESDLKEAMREIGEIEESDDHTAMLTDRDEEARQRAELRLRREAALPQTERLSLDKAVQEQQRIVIVGDPGSGKTTLLRFLARHFAEACQRPAERVTDRDNKDYGATLLPIFVRISRYAEAFHKDKNLKLTAYLSQAFGDVPIAPERLKECFEAFLRAGYGLVLLDGLDEVIDSTDRALIAGEIDSCSSGAGDNQIAVTSRIAGYRAAPLNPAFTEFHLLDMDETQRAQFLKGYLPAYERAVHPEHSLEQRLEDARKARESIEEAVAKNVGVQRLARNPLLLTILALVQRTRAHLPHQRVELYRVASEILLMDWQQARGVESDKCIEDSEALAMFGPTALWLHTERPSGMAPLRDVKYKFAEVLAQERGKKVGDREIQHDVSQFLMRARELTGLFVERANGSYGFLHLTFEEYFAARQMVAEDEKLAAFIHARRHLPRWEEPILLAISYESRDRPPRANRLIRAAILGQQIEGMSGEFTPDPDEAVLHRDLLLAAQCVGDCLRVDHALAQEVGKRIATLYLELCRQKRYVPLQRLLRECIAYLSGTVAGETATLTLLPALQDGDIAVRKSTGDALLQVGQSVLPEAAVSELVRMLQDKDAGVRYSAAQVLEQRTLLPEAAVSELMRMLQDKDAGVRYSAAQVLLKIEQYIEVTIMALVQLLQDESANMRYSAVQALGQQSSLPEAAVSELMRMLQDKDAGVRYSAAQVLEQRTLLSEMATNMSGKPLQYKNADVRSSTAQVLEQTLLPEAAVMALVQLLTDDDGGTRYRAIQGLIRQISLPDTVVTALVGLLQDERPDVRFSAVETLLQTKQQTEAAVMALMKLLADENANVRYSAAQALGRQNGLPEAAVSALVGLLQDKNANVRYSAAETLGQQSTRPRSNIPLARWESCAQALRAMLDVADTDSRVFGETYEQVHDAAWEALWQIRARLDEAKPLPD